MAHFTLFYAAFFFWVSLVAAIDALQPPATEPVPDELTSHGCFGSLSTTASREKVQFVSSGSCWARCKTENKAVVILHADECFCADTYPPRHSLIADAKCDYPCPGYDMEACGGLKASGGSEAYSVYNSGLEVNVEYDDSSSKPTETTSASATSALATSTSASSMSATSASTSAASESAASASSAPVSTTVDNTSQPTSTPSAHTNDATRGFSGVHVLVWVCLALGI